MNNSYNNKASMEANFMKLFIKNLMTMIPEDKLRQEFLEQNSMREDNLAKRIIELKKNPSFMSNTDNLLLKDLLENV